VEVFGLLFLVVGTTMSFVTFHELEDAPYPTPSIDKCFVFSSTITMESAIPFLLKYGKRLQSFSNMYKVFGSLNFLFLEIRRPT
jgi:hypothetical protein